MKFFAKIRVCLIVCLGAGFAVSCDDETGPTKTQTDVPRELASLHARAWDALMANDRATAAPILEALLTPDAVFRIDAPGTDNDVTFPGGGPALWMDTVESISADFGWVGGHHLIGSVVVSDLGDGTARISNYVRASHYLAEGTVDVGEAEWVYDAIFDEAEGTWRIATFTSVVKSLRREGVAAP